MIVRSLRIVLAAALVATACARPVDTLESIQQPEPARRVVVKSGLPIGFGEVLERRQGLILQVQVALVNRSTSDQAFEYRWEWTDAQGFQLGDTISSWQPGFVAGSGQRLLTAAGPGPAAVNFRLYIR